MAEADEIHVSDNDEGSDVEEGSDVDSVTSDTTGNGANSTREKPYNWRRNICKNEEKGYFAEKPGPGKCSFGDDCNFDHNPARIAVKLARKLQKLFDDRRDDHRDDRRDDRRIDRRDDSRHVARPRDNRPRDGRSDREHEGSRNHEPRRDRHE